MDYEELYSQMQLMEKEFKDKLAAASRTFKNLTTDSAKGELKSLSKNLAQMDGFVKDFDSLVARYSQLIEGFDAKGYMENGDFAAQMAMYCQKFSVDIHGDFPVYEMFPYKVKIDSENQELYVDRKKVVCLRPQHFVKSISQSQDKLNKAAFNVGSFLNELADAYDTALVHKEKSNKAAKSESDILLKDLYTYLVPMQRFRREYDMQSYAFDLSRLYSSDTESLRTRDNRAFEFGTSRKSGKLIRILDRDGHEQFLGTIRFFLRTCP